MCAGYTATRPSLQLEPPSTEGPVPSQSTNQHEDGEAATQPHCRSSPGSNQTNASEATSIKMVIRLNVAEEDEPGER